MTRHLKTRYRLLLWLLPLLLVALTYSIAAPSALRAVTPEPAPETATPLPSPPAAVETALDTMATFVPLDDYLANPGMGWQETQTLDNPSLPETTAYRRSQYSWQDQNPAENSFNWSAVDADIQKMASQGKQLSFRIYTMRGEQWGGHQTPQWVLSKGAVILPSGEPDYSNCVYQAQWAKFVEAMRKKYDGNPTLAFIDISGYGNFNEWSWQEQTNVEEGSLDSQARRRLADMFIGGSGSVQCRNASSQTQSVSYNYPGFQKTQLLMPYAGIQQSLRYVAGRRADVGFRHDCLGSAEHTNSMMEKVGDVIAQLWRRAPVVFEFCTGSTSDQTFINNAADILRQAHGSIVHDNLTGSRSAFILSTLLKFVGYRFAPLQISYPSSLKPGSRFNLSMTWVNLGSAPAYPKMGQDFELHVYLMSSNTVIRDWPINANIAAWMPADPLPGSPPQQAVNQTLQFPSTVRSGAYTIRVAIINRRNGQPINLAFPNRDARGRYLVGTINVLPSSSANNSTTFLPLISKG